METLAISALVGGLISFVLERIPAIKKWLGDIPIWADLLVFVALFYGIPLGLAFANCQGYALPLAAATCPATNADITQLVINCTSALMGSQAFHAYLEPRLNTGNLSEAAKG